MFEVAVELLQHAEHVGVLVERPARRPWMAEHQPPPRSGHHLAVNVDVVDGRLGAACQQRGQRPQRRQHRATLGVGAELDHLREALTEAADGGDPAGQLGPPASILVGARRHQLGDRGDRRPQLRARHDRLDRLPHLLQAHLLAPVGGLQQHLHRGGAPGGGLGQLGMAAHRLLVGLPVRLAEQLGGHQQVEQLQGVIDRPGLQLHHRGQQRRQPPLRRMPLQQGRLAGHAVAGQLDQPPLRHCGQVKGPEPRPGDLRHAIQRLAHRRARGGPRALTPPLQLRHPSPLGDLQQ